MTGSFASGLHGARTRRARISADAFRRRTTTGVAFYNLQPGFSKDDIAHFPVPLIDLASGIEDFADTAALVDNLDLVISVDTSVAHLSGAMGKPTWVLHPGIPDWRWEIAGTESPWYPTVRLFRRHNGAWTQTLAVVTEALHEISRW